MPTAHPRVAEGPRRADGRAVREVTLGQPRGSHDFGDGRDFIAPCAASLYRSGGVSGVCFLPTELLVPARVGKQSVEQRHRADAEKEAADEDANIIFGSVIDQQMSDELKVTVIATGFDQADRGRIDNVHSLAVPKKELDIPTHTRNRWERDRLTKVPPPPAPTVNELVEAVDLPTFLRRGQ